MGTFRLILATLVLTYHGGWIPYGYSPGIIAVVSFLLISGFVTAKLIKDRYPTLRAAPIFYLDRCARIFPQYLFIVGLTWAAIAAFGITNSYVEGCTLSKIGLNALAVPLDFYAFNDIGNCMLIPQAWSLGLELTFYAIAPFAILFPAFALAASVASVAVFLFAHFGSIDPDLYGYRLLPGTFFIFMIGAAFSWRGSVAKALPLAAWLITLALIAGAFFSGTIRHPTIEVLLGLAFGIPIVAFLKDRKFSDKDRLLGDLSYGLFLSHILCIWILQMLGLEHGTAPFLAATFVASMCLAGLAYYAAEKNLSRKLRQAIRYDHAGARISLDPKPGNSAVL